MSSRFTVLERQHREEGTGWQLCWFHNRGKSRISYCSRHWFHVDAELKLNACSKRLLTIYLEPDLRPSESNGNLLTDMKWFSSGLHLFWILLRIVSSLCYSAELMVFSFAQMVKLTNSYHHVYSTPTFLIS